MRPRVHPADHAQHGPGQGLGVVGLECFTPLATDVIQKSASRPLVRHHQFIAAPTHLGVAKHRPPGSLPSATALSLGSPEFFQPLSCASNTCGGRPRCRNVTSVPSPSGSRVMSTMVSPGLRPSMPPQDKDHLPVWHDLKVLALDHPSARLRYPERPAGEGFRDNVLGKPGGHEPGIGQQGVDRGRRGVDTNLPDHNRSILLLRHKVFFFPSMASAARFNRCRRSSQYPAMKACSGAKPSGRTM